MTRLVRRHFGGGWMQLAGTAFDLVKTGISSAAEKKKEEERTKQQILEKQVADARAESDQYRAQMAQAAGQYDRGSGSATMGLINSALKVRPDLTYHTPGYTPASQATSASSIATSGNLAGLSSAISTIFKRKPKEDDEEDEEEEVVEAQGEPKDAVKGNLGQAPTQPPVTSVDGSLAEVEEQKKKAAAVQGKLMTNNAAAAKNGCKLKSKFNPRQFKKQK